jgi:hypothetical protein
MRKGQASRRPIRRLGAGDLLGILLVIILLGGVLGLALSSRSADAASKLRTWVGLSAETAVGAVVMQTSAPGHSSTIAGRGARR